MEDLFIKRMLHYHKQQANNGRKVLLLVHESQLSTMQWLCKRCGTLHTQNPEECRNCGHHIFAPIEAHKADQYSEGIESPEPMDSDDIEILSISRGSNDRSSERSKAKSQKEKSDESSDTSSGSSIFERLKRVFWKR